MTELFEVVDSGSAVYKYLDDNGYTEESTNVTLDYDYFLKNHPDVANIFDTNPNGIMRDAIEHIQKGYPKYVSVMITNYDNNLINIRDIRNNHIGKLINIDCVIRKVSDIKQEIVFARYRCLKCGTALPLFEVDERMVRPPHIKCPIDESHTKFVLEPSLCIYRDIQHIVAQERQADAGKQPRSIPCIISSSVVDKIQAGNRVRITGIVKVRIDKRNIASLYIEAVNIRRDSDDLSEVELTDKDRSDIIEASADSNIYKLFADSINPSIYGYDDVKLGLVLSMFGGVTRKFKDGSRIRGESHILLCGDPSTAKSQLIYSVSKIMPRVIYTSGKSTSAAGLTAAAIRDEVDGKWSLEAGALPLANGGVVVCDEFDKLGPDDRSALHEAMELGSISINKAGLSEKLDTETTLIAAANPKAGRFIRTLNLRDQLDLPPSLISRFDLIFTILDDTDENKDSIVARHVLDSRRRVSDTVERSLSIEFMRKYITYAKSINPEITDEVSDYISTTYRELRSNPNTYITVRQLDGLIRLSEASARIKLRQKVTMEDAKRAVNIFFASMDSASLGKGVDVSLFDSTSSKEEIVNKEYVLMMIDKKDIDLHELCDLLVVNRGIEWEDANNLLIRMIDEKLIRAVKSPNSPKSRVMKW